MSQYDPFQTLGPEYENRGSRSAGISPEWRSCRTRSSAVQLSADVLIGFWSGTTDEARTMFIVETDNPLPIL
jgi:hypothetical protein